MTRAKGAVAAQLDAMILETPNLCEVMTLQAIGDKLGVTRERVRQLLPSPPQHRRTIHQQNRLANDSRLIAEYVESHPLALLSRGRGGPAMKNMAKEIGIEYNRFCRVWHSLGYPSKHITALDSLEGQRQRYHADPTVRARQLAATRKWQLDHPERVKEIQRRANKAYYERKKAKRAPEAK